MNTLHQNYLSFANTTLGLVLISIIASIGAIIFFIQCIALSNKFIRPAIENSFYNRILNHWLGPFFSKHKIIATFIRLQGLGDAVVDFIAYLMGTFFVVAMLSSACTAFIISLINDGFVYSLYLVFLIASMAMLSWVLGFNLRFLYKLAHRLK